jgi:hypothetical protein
MGHMGLLRERVEWWRAGGSKAQQRGEFDGVSELVGWMNP